MPRKVKCANCNRTPDQISEYVMQGKIEEMTAEDFVIEEEGTYNPETKTFYCTECYISLGEPLGLAKQGEHNEST